MPSDRAQSVPIGVLRLFVTLVFGALIVILLSRPFNKITQHSRNATTNETAMTAVDYSVLAWDALPFVFLVLSAFGLIVLVVYRRG